MTQWVLASVDATGKKEQIIAYFATKEIYLTDGDMGLLVGSGSKIATQLAAIQVLLEATQDIQLLTPGGLALTQWQENSILNNADLLLSGVPTTYTSMKDIEMDFVI